MNILKLNRSTSNINNNVDKRGTATRFPIELFTKNDINNVNANNLNSTTAINQKTTLLNSFRIRSAQNVAKQRASGMFN